MNKHQYNKLPLQVECACGCGRKFKPKYKWHIYFETKCRVRAWIKRQVEKAEKAKINEVEERVNKIEEQLGIKQ